MSLKDILSVLLVILIWSVNLSIQKVLSDKIALDFFNLLRFASCVPLLWAFKKPSISFFKILSVSLFWNVLAFFFVGLSLRMNTHVGTIAFVYQTGVFFSIGFCFLLLKEIPTIIQILGIIISFLGVALLFGCEAFVSQNIIAANQSMGILLTILAAMSWGFGAILIKKFKLPADLNTNIWITGVASVPMLGIIFLQQDITWWKESYKALSMEILLGALYAGYVANLLGNCVWFSLLKKYPSSLVAPFMLVLPFFSSLIAYFYLDERFTVLQISAFLIILLGLSVNQNLFKYLISFFKMGWTKWMSTN